MKLHPASRVVLAALLEAQGGPTGFRYVSTTRLMQCTGVSWWTIVDVTQHLVELESDGRIHREQGAYGEARWRCTPQGIAALIQDRKAREAAPLH